MRGSLKIAGAVALFSATSIALASPAINGAVMNLRLWNDFPGSSLAPLNNYPSTIQFGETNLVNGGGGGYANRHNWRASDDGGANPAHFLNGDAFSLAANVSISGGGEAEAGLSASPWWSQNFDGVFMLRTSDGNIECWGGRLPYFSFTGAYGLHYTKGTTISEKIEYSPNSLSSADPATIRYTYTDGSGTYSSGWLAFDMGNPAEDPPYGLWGMLNDYMIGGYTQNLGSAAGVTTTFSNIVYTQTPEPASLSLLVLGGLLGLRRR